MQARVVVGIVAYTGAPVYQSDDPSDYCSLDGYLPPDFVAWMRQKSLVAMHAAQVAAGTFGAV